MDANNEGELMWALLIFVYPKVHIWKIRLKNWRQEDCMSVVKQNFGETKEGKGISLYTITSASGAKLSVTDMGAAVVSICVPDRDGKLTDVVLGYEDGAAYIGNGPHFGGTIGRIANRVDQATFMLGGKKIQLTANENGNSLHGGINGWEYQIWDVAVEGEKVVFHHLSKEAEQGVPGDLEVTVTYTFEDTPEGSKVSMHYVAYCDQDTAVNITNHSYFNLDGHDAGSVEDHLLTIYADSYTPVRDSASIPTGEIVPVAGTPMDFRKMKSIGQDLHADFEQLHFTGGYDHNYVLSKDPGILGKVATVRSEKTGIEFEMLTDLPAVQFYSGNYIEQEMGKNGAIYVKRSGFCLEPQYCPDALNQENFESPILKARDVYDKTICYCFGNF